MAEAGRWGRVGTARLRDNAQGLWLPKVHRILLDERLSPVQRRCVLAHEISHARHGDRRCESDGWTEHRADTEAACMLIKPMEYAAAEQIYGQNTHGIAVELGVTQWMVWRYREWLHDHPDRLIIQ